MKNYINLGLMNDKELISCMYNYKGGNNGTAKYNNKKDIYI